MIRSVIAYLGLTVSVTGFLLFLAVGIVIWQMKARVDRQTVALSDRANKTLDSADRAIGYVKDIIKKAQNELAETRREMSIPRTAPVNISPVFRMTAQKASEDLAGSVDRAHNAVVLASEAVVVADAALDVVGGLPELKQLLGVKTEQLDATRTALGNVSNELQQARDVLGVPSIEPGGGPTNEQLHMVDDALRQGEDFTNEVEKVLVSTRARVNETRQEVEIGAWRAAVGTTILSAFGMIGQVFMGRFFWRFLYKPRQA